MLTSEQCSVWLRKRYGLSQGGWIKAMSHAVDCQCCDDCKKAFMVIESQKLILDYLREERLANELEVGSMKPTIGADNDAISFWKWWEESYRGIDLWNVIAGLLYHHPNDQVDKETRTMTKLLIMGLRSRIRK